MKRASTRLSSGSEKSRERSSAATPSRSISSLMVTCSSRTMARSSIRMPTTRERIASPVTNQVAKPSIRLTRLPTALVLVNSLTAPPGRWRVLRGTQEERPEGDQDGHPVLLPCFDGAFPWKASPPPAVTELPEQLNSLAEPAGPAPGSEGRLHTRSPAAHPGKS